LAEVRRLKKEFDENSKSVENLIQIAKESKLEKNLLQTIHLQLGETKAENRNRNSNRHSAEPTITRHADDVLKRQSKFYAPVGDSHAVRGLRRNCLYAKDAEYYDGISTASLREDTISYFYRQLKKEEPNSDENANETGGVSAVDDPNFIKQWRQLQKRESEAKIAAEAAAVEAAAAEAAAAEAAKVALESEAERSGTKFRFEEANKREKVLDAEKRGEKGDEGDENRKGMKMQKAELAYFTRRLGKKISRIQKDAQRLMEERPSGSLMNNRPF